jgi:hypothetical protein
VITGNAGPYGDALRKELYPEIERQFRGIGEAWSRVDRKRDAVPALAAMGWLQILASLS